MKYIMIFIPVLYFLKLYNCDIIYIETFDITIQKNIILTLYLLMTLLWFTATKIKKYCYKNIVSAIAHSIFIIEVFSLIFLTQTSVVLTIAFLMLLGIVFIIFKKRFEKKDKFIKSYVISGAVILLVPFIYVSFIQNLRQPVYIITPDDTDLKASVFATKDEIVSEYTKDLQKLLEWENLNTLEKLELMEIVLNVETSYLGIKPIQVVLTGTQNDIYGMYYKGSRTIVLSHEATKSYEQCIKTLTHECFHAYQTQIMENLDFTNEDVSGCRYFAEAYSWWLNDKNYINDVDKYEEYVSQSIEKSAEKYSEEQIEFYKKILDQ